MPDQKNTPGTHAGLTKIMLVTTCFLITLIFAMAWSNSSQVFHAEQEYLKKIMEANPIDDPDVILSLSAQFINTKRQEEGIAFYEAIMQKFASQLTDHQKALYTCALASIRMSYSFEVSILKRIGWVKESIGMLEEAKQLSNNEEFRIRWLSGMTYAQLPDMFKMRDTALKDLRWCMENMDKAPNPGWIREVYYHIALVYYNDGNISVARRHLKLSGYDDYTKEIYLSTAFAADSTNGATFTPKALHELIPGRLYCVSGFDFSEFFFIITRDRKHTLAVNAGTKPQNAIAVWEYLTAQVGELPPLTDVFITHVDYTYVGGHRGFRKINPDVKFHVRDGWETELRRVLNNPIHFTSFFGRDFKREDVSSFTPDDVFESDTTLEIGGTKVHLLIATCSSLTCRMFVHLPEEKAVFSGDIIMPYVGIPFYEEGEIPDLFNTIDIITSLSPEHILHGYEPLNRYFSDAAALASLKGHIEWLYGRIIEEIQKGTSRVETHHLNLIPPDIYRDWATQLPFMVMREHIINRAYDRKLGYWQPDLEGFFHLDKREWGTLLTTYFNLSEKDVCSALEKMFANGDYEIAVQVIMWAETQYPDSETLREIKKNIYLRLVEKYMEMDPLKFIIYLDMGNLNLPQLAPSSP